MNYKSTFLSSFLILLGISEFSQQDLIPELVTDRSDATESCVLIPKGFFQIELGTQFTDDMDKYIMMNLKTQRQFII